MIESNNEAEVPLWKRCMSYVYPITINTWQQDRESLRLELYLNQFLLSTPNAVYSFGKFYKPFSISYMKIKKRIPDIHSFLLLGTGLGSALKILQEQYDCFPESDLVDIHPIAITWSEEYMQLNKKSNVRWHLCDAVHYLRTCNKKYDLIGIDIFVDTSVPASYKHYNFYRNVYEHLNTGGICIFNNIFNNRAERIKFLNDVQRIFSEHQMIDQRLNTYTIAYK